MSAPFIKRRRNPSSPRLARMLFVLAILQIWMIDLASGQYLAVDLYQLSKPDGTSGYASQPPT